MLDLSADNRDGFEDTDGQLYTSHSFYFRVRNMLYYERKKWATLTKLVKVGIQ